MFTLFVIIFSP